MKRTLNIFGYAVATLLVILFTCWIAIQTPFFQKKLAGIASNRLSTLLKTEVKVGTVSVGLFNRISLKNVLVQDEGNDTLLAAGMLKLAVTDWFFRKDSIEVKYVAVENVLIRLVRKDSVWNHQFLNDAFATDNTDTTNGLGFALQLKIADLRDIRFEQLDLWRGKKVYASADHIYVKGKNTNLQTSLIELVRLELEKPVFREIKDKGLWAKSDSIAYYKRIDSLDQLPKPISNIPQSLVLNIEEVQINNGELQFFNRRKRPLETGYFDDRDIQITELGGSLKSVKLLGDTLTAVTNIRAKERSGLAIKSLQTHFRMTPNLMEFAQLDLVTNRSRLGPYYAMRYANFYDMEYYIDRVEMEAHFRNAQVDIEDIAVFAPELTGIKQQGLLSGDAKGTVSNFEIKNVEIRTGRSKILGEYSMRGLTDIDKTIIEFKTTRSDIDLKDVAVWAPELNDLQQTPVSKLDLITFAGTFKGTAYDFYANGQFNTKAGNFDADLRLKLNDPQMGYTSNISKAAINGGYLFGVPKLGQILFSGAIASNGFGMDNPVLIEGQLADLTYNNYHYNNISIEGDFTKNKLIADLTIYDDNLRANLTTKLDFNEVVQSYNAVGNVQHANFFELGLTRDTILFGGNVQVDFKGNNIDDFLGVARFTNTNITNGKLPLSFDSLYIASTQLDPVNKKLVIQTNEANATVEGKFNLSALANSFEYFLSSYYPAIFSVSDTLRVDQNFSFEINTREIEPFLKIFDERVGGFQFASIIGSLDTENKQLAAEASVPGFTYDQTRFTDIALRATGSNESLSIFGSVGNFQINDKVGFPNAELTIDTQQDSTHLRITTTSSGALGNASIDADIFSQPNGVEISFNESSFIANNKKWTIERGGDFKIKDGFIISNGIQLTQENQLISLNTKPSDEGNWNDVLINIKTVNLGDWLPYFVTEPELEGVATGKITITDPLDKFSLEHALAIEQFSFNNDSIGIIKITGNYDKTLQQIKALVISKNEGYDFEGLVKLNLADTALNQIDTKINIKNERINVLRKYLTDVFDDIDGYASGELKILGDFASPAIIGRLQVKQASLLVEYTKCRYFIDSGIVNLGDNFIDFGLINIKDEQGRTGRIEGLFYHRFFDSLSFNMRLQTNGMQVLNTQAKDNDLFYGKAIAKATFDLTGPLSNLQMRMTGTPTDSSQIFISNKESRASGEADYIVFKDYGAEVTALVDTSTTNFHINLELTANPLCRVDVILDELTGDIISATGSGNLSIRSGSVEPTIMRGRYIVEKGSYNYTFQSFIRKPFILDGGDGNNYIEWNGDPYEANMNILATYIAREVSLRDLISNEGANTVLDQDARNYKGDVFVHAKLNGSLSKPDIEFDIEFPQGSVMRNNISALDMLRRIKEDESEKLRQVTYLIVFRSFAPYRQGGSARNPGADLAVNTISELVSREMGKILTGIIHDITKDQSLSVDLSTNFYNSSQSIGNVNAFNQYDRINVNFNLNKTYFNNRVMVNVGSDFDLNVRNTTTTGFQFLPDVSVEFILTSNRRLRAILFKRDNLDIVGRRNRAGASISYRKDFDKLFGNKEQDSLLFIKKEDELAEENEE